MSNIAQRLFSIWKPLWWAFFLWFGLSAGGAQLAAAQTQAASLDEEAENAYSFSWPPQPWLRQIFYMAVPEPMGDKEVQEIKAAAEQRLANPQASEKQKRQARLLLLLADGHMAEANSLIAALRAQYPAEPEFVWVDGVMRLMENQPEEALRRFLELSALVPDDQRNWKVLAKQSEAWALLALNRFEDAFEIAQNQVAKLQAGAALKSHQGWFTYYIYGQVWAHKGFNETALKCYRLARIRWIKGPDGGSNTTVGRYLELKAGDGNMVARQYRNAQKLYLNLTLDRRAVFGQDHLLSLEAQHRLVLACFAIGEIDKAVELGDEFIAMAPNVFGPESDQMLDIMTVMAKVAMLRYEWPKAENLLNRILAILQAKPAGSAKLPLANAYMQAAGLYLATNRPAAAEDYFRRGYDLACGTSEDVNLTGACLISSYQIALSLAKANAKDQAMPMLIQAKKMAEDHKMATIYSEQYAAIAALAAELEKDKPQLADFKNLTIR